MISFKDKVVWVTGNITGIGRETTLMFAELGAKVIVHGFNNEEQSNELFEKLSNSGADVIQVEGDVTKKQDIEQIVEEIKNQYGRIDILVNNVGGFVKKGSLETIEENDWDQIMDVNLKSVFLVTQSALPLMKLNGGKIVNFVSGVARNGGNKDNFAYTAAKGGVASLTRALAKQLIDYNIIVNAVAPGLVDTPFHTAEGNGGNNYDTILSKIPMKRVGEAKDLANVVIFLASHLSDYMLGEIIEVSGGRRLT